MGNEHMIRDLFTSPENTRESFQNEYEREHSRRHPRQAGVSPQVTMGNKDKVRDRFTSPQKIGESIQDELDRQRRSIQDELDRQRSRRQLSQAGPSPQVTMGNKDKVRDRFTSPQKIGGSIQDELDRQRSRRQLSQAGASPQNIGGSVQDELDRQRSRRELSQAGVRSKRQKVGHIPRIVPSEQDLDTGSTSQAGQKTHNPTAVAGAQRASKEGKNPCCQPPSQTSGGFQKVSQRTLSGRPVTSSRSNESSRRPNFLEALAEKDEQDRGSTRGQQSAYESQTRVDRRIAVAKHNVIDYNTCPRNIRDIRIHPRPTSWNSQCGTVLANEDDYLVREEGLHDDGEWDRCEMSSGEED